ncbi:MAG: 4Fe-4S binding protein [Desulfatitalea sp.]|nr:4Fe-4S binding protein [Desulfatitalea sp.]NNK00379.1 4Fe-4S binding protein [Desulfatitalea sp.]
MISRIPYIEWDGEKCQTPMACKKCVEICPTMVFRSGFYKVRYVRGKESDIHKPGNYRITPDWLNKCIGCMECVKICPVDALKVEFREIEKA